MPKYTVNDGEKQYNGKAYQPGDTIECTEDEAKQMRLSASPGGESTPPFGHPSRGEELSPAGGGAGGGNKGKKK